METQTRTDASAKALLSTAAVIAAGTQAYGSPVRFENDTGYDWYFTTIDLTKPASQQTYGNAVDGRSLYLDYFSDFYPAFSYFHSYTSGAGAEVWNGGFSNRYAAPFNAGQDIGSGMSGGAWNQSSTLEFAWYSKDCTYYYYYQYPYGGYGYYICDYDSGNRGLLPTDGSDTYIGVRLTIDSNLHYGWIGLNNSGGFISVFAWGYETEPGVSVPAGAPAPGSLGILALGAVGALRRSRRPE